MNVSASSLTTNRASTAGAGAAMKTTDFLRLMTEQLKQQDPFAPADNAQMVAQMAQMSASSGIADINTTLERISAQLADQSALLKSLKLNTES